MAKLLRNCKLSLFILCLWCSSIVLCHHVVALSTSCIFFVLFSPLLGSLSWIPWDCRQLHARPGLRRQLPPARSREAESPLVGWPACESPSPLPPGVWTVWMGRRKLSSSVIVWYSLSSSWTPDFKSQLLFNQGVLGKRATIQPPALFSFWKIHHVYQAISAVANCFNDSRTIM